MKGIFKLFFNVAYLDISNMHIKTFLINFSSTMSAVSNKQVSRTPKSFAHFKNASENKMCTFFDYSLIKVHYRKWYRNLPTLFIVSLSIKYILLDYFLV